MHIHTERLFPVMHSHFYSHFAPRTARAGVVLCYKYEKVALSCDDDWRDLFQLRCECKSPC